MPSPCIHWRPSPASTRTSPLTRSIALSWWCDGVRDVRRVADHAEPVGLAEAAPLAHHLARRVELDHPVVARVRDQHVPARQRRRVRREPQRARLHLRRDVRRPGRLQRALVAVLRHQLAEQPVERVRVPLAGVLRDDVALRVDQHQRRPRPRRVGLPGHQLRVVEHRVVHAVPLDRRAQRLRVGLVHELRRVHADHDQLLGVLLLDRPQLVEHVQAVDAAEGPEVQQHEPAAQLADRVRRAAGVQPAPAAELGGADACGHSASTYCLGGFTPRTPTTVAAMTDDSAELAGYVEVWWQAVNDFLALLEEVPEDRVGRRRPTCRAGTCGPAPRTPRTSRASSPATRRRPPRSASRRT